MYYFASDMHLGLGPREKTLAREKLLVRWLEKVAPTAKAIYIVGDMFDFWYEYKRVVPKGYTRLLGALSTLTDNGAEIHFFPGNHDLWAYDYLERECGVRVHHRPGLLDLYGKKVYVEHGDNITARTNFWTRTMNGIFRSRAARWVFSHFVHPNSAVRFGLGWSGKSRKSKEVAHRFLAEEEPMVRFARRYREDHDVDYFIFGHNHCAEIYPLGEGVKAVFLGEWIENPVYAAMDPAGNIFLEKVDA